MKPSKLIIKENTKPQVAISVRNLVEFLMREGDIDDRRSGGVDSLTAMAAGAKIHKRIQKSEGSFYHAEVGLSFVMSYDEFDLGVEGRADGLIYDEDEAGNIVGVASGGAAVSARGAGAYVNVIVDEIKGMYADVMSFTEPIPVHEAQAKCYAFILANENNLPAVDVRLTYVNIETDEMKQLVSTYTFDELSDWFYKLIEEYRPWAEIQYVHRKERNASIKGLPFPYEYRPGQKKLVTDVYRCISSENNLFIQAPTGTGKTIATMYPAVMAMGQDMSERIFYLSAKTATASVAKETVSLLREGGFCGKCVQITAKDKACVLDERACNPDDCGRAKGHLDRINEALFDVITHESVITREVISEYADKHKVCPFELSLDVSSWMDVIICDYNYVFDPNVYLKRFFADGRPGENIFLIDEAHNMVDRAREMYSETIIKEDILYVKGFVKNYSKKTASALEKLNKLLLAYKKEYENAKNDAALGYENGFHKAGSSFIRIPDIDSMIYAMSNVYMYFEELLAKNIKFGEHQDDFMDLFFKVRNFMNILEGYDTKHYVTYCDVSDEKQFCFHLYCVDPSAQLQTRLDMSRSAIYFSATLLPINYYKSLLTTEQNAYAIYADSVFDTNNRLLCIGNDVSSKYNRRGHDEYRKFADYVKTITRRKKGNYMVFCPSYAFIDNVAELIRQDIDNPFDTGMDDLPFGCDTSLPKILIQSRNMNEREREDFLNEFSYEHENGMVAFCTLGGIFSEGIDLTEDKLIGVIVVGAGLPQVCQERQIMSDFFEENGRNGFEFAYLYPGINKVIQAAGRLIRTDKDRGVIALLDERFLLRAYKNCFPREWADARSVSILECEYAVDEFWNTIE